MKATHNVDEDKALKKAIGQKTFDLDIGAEELNQIIDESFTNSDSARNNNKFARFLRMVTYLLTYLLTHSLTYLLTHSLTHSLTHTHPLTYLDEFKSSIRPIL